MKRFNAGEITHALSIFFALWVVVLVSMCFGIQDADAAVIPIGANQDWTTDLWIRNLSTDVVTQKLGHLTFTKPGFDPIILESTITLQPNETRRFVKVDQFYDSGLWILHLDSRLEASAFLSYRGTATRFEMNALEKGVSRPGDGAMFYRIAIDSAGVGTFPVILSDYAEPIQLEIILYSPNGATVLNDYFVKVGQGITMLGVPTLAPNGGSLRICHTACGIGLPASPSTFYPFVITGPSNGADVGVRYPQ